MPINFATPHYNLEKYLGRGFELFVLNANLSLLSDVG